jgi:excisionase family DNA binding protein
MQAPADTYQPTHHGTYQAENRLVSVQEAAARLGVSPSTIRRWVKDGRVRSERVSRPQGYVVLVELPEQAPTATYPQHPPQVSTHLPTAAPTELARAEVMAAYVEQIQRPLLERIESQAERIGRLEAENEQLRGQLALAAPKGEPADHHPVVIHGTDTKRPWWKFWSV